MGIEENTGYSIAENLQIVRSRIKSACIRSGRKPEDVTLVAVSKTKPFGDIMEAWKAGAVHFGENYVQEMMQKIGQFDAIGSESHPYWHMIGHLQKNKVRYLIGHTTLIHSVDTLSLAMLINKEAEKKNQVVRILLEVNAAGEESKWGFDLCEVKQAAEDILSLSNVRVLGLMTSAPITDDPETNRGYFRKLHELVLEMAAKKLIFVSDPEFPGPVLSMGMTGDFEVAVEEGATMVRVGTAIFGKRGSAV